MIEKGLGGDWETLRRYLPTRRAEVAWGPGSSQRHQRQGAGMAPLEDSTLALTWSCSEHGSGLRWAASGHLASTWGAWESPVVSFPRFSLRGVLVQLFLAWTESSSLARQSEVEFWKCRRPRWAFGSDNISWVRIQPMINWPSARTLHSPVRKLSELWVF